jgi:hypothetical protein
MFSVIKVWKIMDIFHHFFSLKNLNCSTSVRIQNYSQNNITNNDLKNDFRDTVLLISCLIASLIPWCHNRVSHKNNIIFAERQFKDSQKNKWNDAKHETAIKFVKRTILSLRTREGPTKIHDKIDIEKVQLKFITTWTHHGMDTSWYGHIPEWT